MTRITFAALLIFLLSGCGGHGPKVQHGSIEVFYVDGATKEDADRLGAYLTTQWGAGGAKRSVQIKKAGDGYQLRMVVRKEFQKDDKTLEALVFDGARVSRDIFAGAPVEIQACDEHFTTIKTMPPRADVRYGVVERQIEVFYAAEADKEDALRLARHLAGQAPALTLKLARRGPVVEVHLVTLPDAHKQPDVMADMRRARAELAANVFRGAAVELHLCDDRLNPVHVLRP